MRLESGDIEWTVEDCHPPLRLDHYLKLRLPSYARTTLQRYIRQGGVKRRARSGSLSVLKPSSKVRPGDRIWIRRPEPPPRANLSGPRQDAAVLFEDEFLVVVDKPAGMLVHPSGVRMDGTLIELMRAQFGPGIDLAHRLDRETSGVIVLTRTRATTREVKDAFKQRRVSKRYLALVHGCPAWDTRIADLPMGVAGAEVRVRQTIRADGAPARTLFKVVRRFSNWYALLEAAPETGRLHQIRVHLEALGLPVYGDKIYGGDGSTFLEFYRSGLTPELLGRLGHWRHALHAQRIELVHPADGRRVRFEAPLPDDLVQLMATLDAKPEHRPNEGIFASHVREGD